MRGHGTRVFGLCGDVRDLQVSAVALSADNQLGLTGSDDKKAALWSASAPHDEPRAEGE